MHSIKYYDSEYKISNHTWEFYNSFLSMIFPSLIAPGARPTTKEKKAVAVVPLPSAAKDTKFDAPAEEPNARMLTAQHAFPDALSDPANSSLVLSLVRHSRALWCMRLERHTTTLKTLPQCPRQFMSPQKCNRLLLHAPLHRKRWSKRESSRTWF